jgi:hypothetical protein
MNWRRVNLDGENPRHYKEWRAGRGRYRVHWRNRACGITVLPGYYACVRIMAHELGRPIWDFVEPRRKSQLYRTRKAAMNACEKHADPNYRPKKKAKSTNKASKRKAPMKACPKCETKVHVRKVACDCGYTFPKKVKE